MDHVFLFAFNGELIVFERRKKIKLKQNRQGNENKRQFSRQNLTHAYYAFASYVSEGHLYDVFLV